MKMNTSPHSVSLGTELNLFTLLAEIFPPALSLALNRFLQIMVGFIGMFLLCRKYILTDKSALPAAVVAILFAILPFWSSGCLSIAAQPLVLYSFLRIRDKKNTLWDWLVMVLYPFASSLIVFGVFFYVFLFVLLCIDWYKKKTINSHLFLALVLLSFFSLITSYREILSIFIDSNFVSHRTEFSRATLSLKTAIVRAIFYIISGQGHARSNHIIIIIMCSTILIYNWFKNKKLNNKLFFLLLLFFSISFFSGLIQWEPVSSVVSKISFFKLFNINRFYSLFPLITFLCLSFAVTSIPKNQKGYLFLCILFLIQFTYSIKKDYTYSGFLKNTFGMKNENTITFNEFYSEPMFDDIKTFINEPTNSYKVAALGFHPAVLQYNGFYTIDGYCANYDLNYKHKIGNLIAEELKKNNTIGQYFHSWGSRCYVFDNEAGRFGKYRSDVKETESLDLNYEILKSMNCKFIISSVLITNMGEHLESQSVFENSVWKIYLYKVI